MNQKITVTPRQVELAQAKVEADEVLGREPDVLAVLVAGAHDGDENTTEKSGPP